MSSQTGGTAFPSSEEQTEGMSLRDWFAGRVLAGLFASGRVRLPFQEGHQKEPERIAEFAYQYADAMLAARRAVASEATAQESKQ